MMIMVVNGAGIAFTELRDALDLVLLLLFIQDSEQSSSLYNVGTMWLALLCLSSFSPFNALLSVCLCLCFSQHQAVLSASLLCADSRDHHNLRWEGPRYNYLLSVKRTGGPLSYHLGYWLSTGWFFTLSGHPGLQCTLRFVLGRGQKDEKVSIWLFSLSVFQFGSILFI